MTMEHTCMPKWRGKIAEARERKAKGYKPFTDLDIYNAENWNCCAIGEVFSVGPQKTHDEVKELHGPGMMRPTSLHHGSVPIISDRKSARKLWRLGVSFADVIGEQDVEAAERILDRIDEVLANTTWQSLDDAKAEVALP